MRHPVVQCTVVGVSSTPTFLIIFHFFQIQNFMVLQQSFSYKFFFEALEVDLNHFGYKKWQFLTFFFQISLHKINILQPKATC